MTNVRSTKARTDTNHLRSQIRLMAGENSQAWYFRSVTKPLFRQSPRPGPNCCDPGLLWFAATWDPCGLPGFLRPSGNGTHFPGLP